MAQYEHLPIYKKSMDLAIYIENVVRGFSRYHKYSIGADLRQLSREIEVPDSKHMAAEAVMMTYRRFYWSFLSFTELKLKLQNKLIISRGMINSI